MGLDRACFNPPDPAMFFASRKRVVWALPLLVSLALAGSLADALASSDPKPAEPPPKPKPTKPSSLTGNALPKCEAGTFAAGNLCKPAVPGFYAPSGALYPVACPEGMTSKSGSRSAGECFPEDGAPAPPPPEKPKGGH